VSLGRHISNCFRERCRVCVFKTQENPGGDRRGSEASGAVDEGQHVQRAPLFAMFRQVSDAVQPEGSLRRLPLQRLQEMCALQRHRSTACLQRMPQTEVLIAC